MSEPAITTTTLAPRIARAVPGTATPPSAPRVEPAPTPPAASPEPAQPPAPQRRPRTSAAQKAASLEAAQLLATATELITKLFEVLEAGDELPRTPDELVKLAQSRMKLIGELKAELQKRDRGAEPPRKPYAVVGVILAALAPLTGDEARRALEAVRALRVGAA